MDAADARVVSVEEVVAALERVLASREFAPGTRAARFLRFVVEEALAGRSERLKEFTVGVDVFDRRPERFDSRTDPIVRVEARRVRDKLAAYYDGAGRADGVVISLPKGSYVPVWARARANAALAGTELGIAVLPFLNLTGDAHLEPFADALTDEITDALVKLPGLKVVARTSAFHFKGRHVDVRSVGATLGVAAVLEGSVQLAGDRMKVIAQLNRTRDGFHIWSSIHEARLADPFVVQAEIARRVARTILPGLRDAQAADPEKRRPRNDPAWEAYVRAGYHLRKVSPHDFRLAFGLAEQVVVLDPDFARGHALLGAARLRAAQAWGVNGATDLSLVDQARQDLRRAIALDPHLGSAHCALARLALMIDYDWPAAREGYERALSLAPGVADVQAAWGHALALRRRFDEARCHLAMAAELDPLSLLCRLLLANLALQEGDHAAAIAGFDDAIALEPANLWAGWALCLALAHGGQLERAARETERLGEREPAFPHPRLLLAAIAARRGAAADALVAIDREAAAPHAPRWPYAFAVAYALAGHPAGAFEWLERARVLRDSNFAWIHADPAFDGLRDDPRFAELLARVPGFALAGGTAERQPGRASAARAS